MSDLLYAVDLAIFRFINGTLGNPVSDLLMPPLTDLNVRWFGRILIVSAWLLLFMRGGKRGRAAALLLVPLVVTCDQFNSAVVKQIFARPRPCHLVDGAPVVSDIRLLVDCGGGYSFPSTHAFNHFAGAGLLARFFPGWKAYCFGWATLMGVSRICVGVHYPSDVLGGMACGLLMAWIFIFAWKLVVSRYPALEPYAPPA